MPHALTYFEALMSNEIKGCIGGGGGGALLSFWYEYAVQRAKNRSLENGLPPNLVS